MLPAPVELLVILLYILGGVIGMLLISAIAIILIKIFIKVIEEILYRFFL